MTNQALAVPFQSYGVVNVSRSSPRRNKLREIASGCECRLLAIPPTLDLADEVIEWDGNFRFWHF